MAYQQLPENMYYNPFKDKNTNDEQRNKMKQIVKGFIDTQLTNKQKEVLLLHIEGKNITQIASDIGINKSTVQRNLKATIKKIEKFKKIFENVAL